MGELLENVNISQVLARAPYAGLIMAIIKARTPLLKQFHKHCVPGPISDFGRRFPFLFSNWGKQAGVRRDSARVTELEAESLDLPVGELTPHLSLKTEELVPTRNALVLG